MRRLFPSFLAVLSFLSFSSLVTLSAQVVPAASTAVVDPYAGEAVVIEHADSTYVMNADGTGYYERTLVAKMLSDAAVRDLGVVTLSFASAVSHVEFKYARARHADGSVTETPLADVMEQPAQVTVQAPFYSDLKQAQLPVKGLKVGDTLEWQARVVITKAESPGQFWGEESFIADTVVRKETVSLSVPSTTTVNVWTNPKADSKVVESTEGDRHVYRWEHAALKSTADRKADAEKSKTTPLTADEELDAEKGKLPSLAWTTFKSWAAVGAWYRGLESDREMPSEEVKTKVAELTKDKATEEEKVRAVYGYASAQIRYIGVAFGVGRYQPHRADSVLENQYGDCKDKHTLLASMLLALGLHPDAALIGAGVRFNAAVPSPAAFNHMITRVKVNGSEVWLDATAEVAPYKMLTKTIRGQEALVVPDTGAATIERTPKDVPFAQAQTWEAKGSLDEKGVSESHIVMTLRGDTELLIREVMRQVPRAQYDAFMKKLLEGLGYQGTPTNTVISRAELTDEPLKFSFDYHREQGGDWPNHQVVPQVAPVALPRVDEKNPPVGDLNLDSPRTETSTAEMKIPDGWGAELPEAVHEKTPWVTYDESYRFEKGVLYTQRKLVVLQERIPAGEWKTYKTFQDAVNPGMEAYIHLTKTGTIGGGKNKFTVPGQNKGTPVSDASAEKLIQDAMTALQKSDTASAKSLLDQAQAKDPKQQYLWLDYAGVAGALGENNESMKDLEKELSLHPETVRAYLPLVSMQLAKHDTKAAIATLRRWIAANTLDLQPVNILLGTLYQEKKYSEGLDAVDLAMKQLPDEQKKDENFRLNVAQMEMKGGRTKQGETDMLELLKTSTGPLTLNNAAYALSEEGLDLPEAEQASRNALATLTKESLSWTLDESPNVLRQQSSLLVASWDTLGWILFREGKLEEALDYCSAAWQNNLHEEVGSHVVAIRAAMAKPAEAAKLEKAEPPKGNPAPGKSNQDLRTVALGPAGSTNGASGYRLLIAKSKIERVVSTDEKKLSGGTEMLQGRSLIGYTPTATDGKVVREVMLNCYSGKCQIVFMPQ